MNTLAQSDLRHAYQVAKLLADSEVDPRETLMDVSKLCDVVLKLCHVCQALGEDLDNKANPGDRLAELQLRIYKLEKALKCHTETQDAHNF